MESANGQRFEGFGWYWSSISNKFAARMLQNKDNGSFLVYSTQGAFIRQPYLTILALNLDNQTYFFNMTYPTTRSNVGDPTRYNLFSKLVKFLQQLTRPGNCAHTCLPALVDNSGISMEVKLVPVSRLKITSSLKHACRCAMLAYVKPSEIELLRLPNELRDYLKEPHDYEHQKFDFC